MTCGNPNKPVKLLMWCLSMLVWIAAGAASYLFVLNRLLIQLRDRRHKSFLVRAGGLLSVGFSALLGARANRTGWRMLPAAALVLAFAGEVRRLLLRTRHRGAPPVAEEGPSVRLNRPQTTTDLVLRQYEVRMPNWRGPAVRVAHVSDFHLNSHLPLSYFQDAMHRIAAKQPDLVLITGDFVTHAEFIPLLAEVLPLAQGRLGSFGVLGNHDTWADAAAVQETANAAGVCMLSNGSVRIPLGDGASILLAGDEHPWVDGAWHEPDRMPGELAFLLTHTPDNIHRPQGAMFDAVFAGHYHGGQIRVPGIGALVMPSKYGRQYDGSHFVFGRTHLFVTAGVGSAEPPLRIWCPPDILLVDFLPDGDGVSFGATPQADGSEAPGL